MSLSEKAKFAKDIAHTLNEAYANTYDVWKTLQLEEWVRLEDARQEIDCLKDCLRKSGSTTLLLSKDLQKLERERGKQKQKLRQLKLKFSEIEAIIWAICEPDSLGYIGYTILEEFKKEFGELIKETC